MEDREFDSFLFWRQPIVELDLSELYDLGLSRTEPSNQSAAREQEGRDQGDQVTHPQELCEFSTFNFWRAPLVSVDALIGDLNLLL